MITQQYPPKDPLYGWVMVFVVFVLSALSFGVLASISVFLKPLAAEFGWTRSQTASGYTAITFASAIAGIAWGYVADRFGTRWFGFIGVAAMTVSLLLLSRQSSIYEFYALYFLFGALANAVLATPLYANVGFWFRKNPGLALGITAAGGAFGQGLVPFLVGLVIAESGWQSAYTAMGWGYLIIAAPLAFLIKESPWREQARTMPESQPRQSPLSEVEVVAWIGIAVVFCCNCMAVPIVHLVPLQTDAGRSVEFATGILMVLMFAGVVGRIYGGKLADTMGALPAYMLMSLGQTLSAVFFPHVSGTAGLVLLAVFFGFTYSGVMTASVVCVRMMVSAGSIGRAMGVTAFFGWVGMGLGAYFGGLFYDLSGDYDWSFAFASIMGVVNLLILIMFHFRIASRHRIAAAA